MTISAIVRNVPPKRGRGRPPEATRDVPPTPETKAKAQKDFIASLPDDLGKAATAIDKACRYSCGKAMSRAGSLEPRTDRTREKDIDPESSLAMRMDTYRRWQIEMGARNLPLNWVIAMVVDMMPNSEVDWRTHHPQGWAAERLIEALELYCKVGR